MTLRQLAAELSAADPHWNVEPLIRAADALEWIVGQPTRPNDQPQANWWDLRDAALWGLGLSNRLPVASGGTFKPREPT